MKKRIRVNDGHYLEMLDRLHCQMTDIETHLLGHPVCMKHEDLRTRIIRSIVSLTEAYQLAGSHSVKKTKKKIK